MSKALVTYYCSAQGSYQTPGCGGSAPTDPASSRLRKTLSSPRRLQGNILIQRASVFLLYRLRRPPTGCCFSCSVWWPWTCPWTVTGWSPLTPRSSLWWELPWRSKQKVWLSFVQVRKMPSSGRLPSVESVTNFEPLEKRHIISIRIMSHGKWRQIPL